MHTAYVGQFTRAYSAMSALGASSNRSDASEELDKIRLYLIHSHLKGAAFGRLLANADIALPRLEGLVKVIVWDALTSRGINTDDAVPARAGEPGYGWTNGGWLLSQLEAELRQMFLQARTSDRNFSRTLARAIG